MKNAFLRERETKQELANFVLNTKMFSMGEQCLAFEHNFAKYQSCKYALLFNSGGSANLALLQALKSMGRLKEGDKVGFSSLTWSTNVMPIIQMGMIPVPIDCDIETINVMSHNLETRLKEVKLELFLQRMCWAFVEIWLILKTCVRGIILFLLKIIVNH